MNSVRKHILIADSDELVLIHLERMLQDDGFETTTAWTTSQTVELIGKQQFDLLLVADHPPELNCETVLRQTRSQGGKVPLVVLENSPRHPFAEPFLMNLGASRIVHKWQPGAVKEAVQGMLVPGAGVVAQSAVAGAPKLG
jgi:DNA-binding response OmpR family regulator